MIFYYIELTENFYMKVKLNTRQMMTKLLF